MIDDCEMKRAAPNELIEKLTKTKTTSWLEFLNENDATWEQKLWKKLEINLKEQDYKHHSQISN